MEIMEDDSAMDVADEWHGFLRSGMTPSEASRATVAYWVAFADEHEVLVSWLALAAVQMEDGQLQRDVRDRALSILDAGGDLAWWANDAEQMQSRKTALDALATELRSANPMAKDEQLEDVDLT